MIEQVTTEAKRRKPPVPRKTAPAPTQGNQVDFAKHMSVSKMRVSEWKRMGLLAFTEDGQVHFERSKVLIEVQSGAPERLGIFTGNRAKSRERKDLYEAENARLDLDERCGLLTETKTIVDASSTAGAMVRSRAENMPYVLAPQVAAAGGDEERCRAILADWVEEFLRESSQAFASIAASARQRSARGAKS